MSEANNKFLIAVRVQNWHKEGKEPRAELYEYSTPLCSRDWRGWSNWGMSAVVEIIKRESE